MNKFKVLGLISALSMLAVAGQAFATPCPTTISDPSLVTNTSGSPVCIAQYGLDGSLTGLQSILGLYNAVTNPNGIITSGPGVNVYTDQTIPSSFWSIGGTGTSANKIVLEFAGNANVNTFGVFDPNNPANYLQLFSGPASSGWTTSLTNLGGGSYVANYFNALGVFQGSSSATFSVNNLFGYYLDTPNGFFYSDPAMNETGGTVYPNGTPHMVAYDGNGTNTIKVGNVTGVWGANEYIMAWEDTPFAKSDLDYQDFIVIVESVHPIPEPAVLGMFGLGLIGVMFAVRMRRRNNRNS